MMRRTPLKRGGPLKRTPLARVSAKKRVADADYARVRKEVLDACRHICQMRIAGVCMVRATTTHHRLHRSAGGKHEADNLIGCCIFCHEYVEKNPSFAVERGWTVQRNKGAK
jgi:hypothetical protein